MLESTLAIIAGFALLVWGADRFVMGASATASNLGVSPLIIGLTIVGFGTSAPEMLVSAIAAASGNPDLGIGNAIGSNITNVGLVLGVTALISPLAVHSKTLKREFPILILIILFTLALIVDGDMSRNDGMTLLIGLFLLMSWMVWTGLREHHGDPDDPMESEYSDEIPSNLSTAVALTWLFVGLFILLGSSRMLVWGAVNIAHWLGVSDLIIGLTIVAIGTSLPELAASVMSAIRGEHDIAIGNVLGSNMFNLLAVLGLPGVIAPTAISNEILFRDYALMILLTLLLFIMAYGFRGPGRINRIEGGILLLIYSGYLGFLYLSHQ
ncbi:MAG: calcium/sodium antiporter [Gammaproteobacteria bacterium]|nr:calcium/sodium antiporter [Gammaproteobacteria bacterium]